MYNMTRMAIVIENTTVENADVGKNDNDDDNPYEYTSGDNAAVDKYDNDDDDDNPYKQCK
jgi:hypothetical protein